MYPPLYLLLLFLYYKIIVHFHLINPYESNFLPSNYAYPQGRLSGYRPSVSPLQRIIV